jgi:tetratricopeptide (TPR) repeat protein
MRNRTGLLAALLAAACFAAYFGAWNLDWVNFDDLDYITENPMVTAGLGAEQAKWAFTSGHASNWQPLTWLSHQLDVVLFGTDPAGPHVVNLLLHTLNCLLIFALMNRASRAPLRSFIVASLFAVHPLHVESVAWVSERKDVLSTLFMMATLLVYQAWAWKPRPALYASVIVFFVLGLMSKPMLVTLPFALLLFDAWPLNRLDLVNISKDQVLSRVTEKWPLFLMSAASSFVTYSVQAAGGAMAGSGHIDLVMRLQNALVSWVHYMAHMFWPSGLAAYYPYPESIPAWQWTFALLLLMAISFAAMKWRAKYPYLLVGWLWYLGTSVPVIGIVQVGSQSMADRYTYVPLIGLFIIVAWAGTHLLRAVNVPPWMSTTAVLAMVVKLSFATQAQMTYWKDSETLWARALDVTHNNFRAHNSLGVLIAVSGRHAEAMEHFRAAIRINPRHAEGHNRLGATLASLGRHRDALPHYREAVRLEPSYAEAWSNLGLATTQTGAAADALSSFDKALQLYPGYAMAYFGLAVALNELGRLDEAESRFREALRLDPSFDEAHGALAVTLFKAGRLQEAISELEKAIELNPTWSNYRLSIAQLLNASGERDRAIRHLETVLELEPDNANARQIMQFIRGS